MTITKAKVITTISFCFEQTTLASNARKRSWAGEKVNEYTVSAHFAFSCSDRRKRPEHSSCQIWSVPCKPVTNSNLLMTGKKVGHAGHLQVTCLISGRNFDIWEMLNQQEILLLTLDENWPEQQNIFPKIHSPSHFVRNVIVLSLAENLWCSG